jgi:hypothetical protein
VFAAPWWQVIVTGLLFGFGFAAGQALFVGIIGLFRPKSS